MICLWEVWDELQIYYPIRLGGNVRWYFIHGTDKKAEGLPSKSEKKEMLLVLEEC